MKELKHLPIEFDAKAVKEDGTFEGYASTFGNVDSYFDTVVPGAFTKSLAERPASKIKMLRSHNENMVIGIWREAKEDSKGLAVSGLLDLNVQLARETHSLMKLGALDGLSIGYQTIESEFAKSGVRQLKEIGLWEISVVTFQADLHAVIERVKATLAQDWDEKTVEHVLREAGMSKEFAKRVTLHGLKRAKEQFDRREADGCSESGAQTGALTAAMRKLEMSFRA